MWKVEGSARATSLGSGAEVVGVGREGAVSKEQGEERGGHISGKEAGLRRAGTYSWDGMAPWRWERERDP